jgi:hypothetical protein
MQLGRASWGEERLGIEDLKDVSMDQEALNSISKA